MKVGNIWNWFIAKIIPISQNICFEAIQIGGKSNKVLEAWTEVCYQNFGGWETQTIWNLLKMCAEKFVSMRNKCDYTLVRLSLIGLWHIKHCWLFNAKFCFCIYTKYIWFGWVLWHINHCWLFNTKSCFYIYI